MLTGHRAVGTWRNAVHQYIALTDYVRDQLIAGGLPAARISVKPNFVAEPRADVVPGSLRDYFIYVGRLSLEKGLDVLFDAWKLRPAQSLLRIVGAGTIPPGLSPPDGVEFLGQLSLADTYDLIARAKAIILPVRWAEPFGRVVIEAFALGTPVICSSAGGLPELVTNNQNGVVVDVGDAAALAAAIMLLSTDESLRLRLGECARDTYLARFTPQVNYDILMGIYRSAMQASISAR
jgi:glycosyltransferase involved in cell wall biosynthesis